MMTVGILKTLLSSYNDDCGCCVIVPDSDSNKLSAHTIKEVVDFEFSEFNPDFKIIGIKI